MFSTSRFFVFRPLPHDLQYSVLFGIRGDEPESCRTLTLLTLKTDFVSPPLPPGRSSRRSRREKLVDTFLGLLSKKDPPPTPPPPQKTRLLPEGFLFQKGPSNLQLTREMPEAS